MRRDDAGLRLQTAGPRGSGSVAGRDRQGLAAKAAGGSDREARVPAPGADIAVAEMAGDKKPDAAFRISHRVRSKHPAYR